MPNEYRFTLHDKAGKTRGVAIATSTKGRTHKDAVARFVDLRGGRPLPPGWTVKRGDVVNQGDRPQEWVSNRSNAAPVGELESEPAEAAPVEGTPAEPTHAPWPFAVGQRVRRIGNAACVDDGTLGTVKRIAREFETTEVAVLWDTDPAGMSELDHYDESQVGVSIEAAPAEEAPAAEPQDAPAPAFQVGQRVRRTEFKSENIPVNHPKPGETGTVVGIGPVGVVVQWDDRLLRHIYSGEWRKAIEPVPMRPFQLGDKVKRTDFLTIGMQVQEGTMGKVVPPSANATPDCVGVKFEGCRGVTHNYPPEHVHRYIELVEAAPEPPRADDDWQVGDRVRRTGHNQSGLVPQGTLGTVVRVTPVGSRPVVKFDGVEDERQYLTMPNLHLDLVARALKPAPARDLQAELDAAQAKLDKVDEALEGLARGEFAPESIRHLRGKLTSQNEKLAAMGQEWVKLEAIIGTGDDTLAERLQAMLDRIEKAHREALDDRADQIREAQLLLQDVSALDHLRSREILNAGLAHAAIQERSRGAFQLLKAD